MIGFAAPWILLGLIGLPAIWFFLRVTPPLPKRAVFPPMALLRDLPDTEQTPAGTPWWLLLIRMLALALIVTALAGPRLDSVLRLAGKGPLLLYIDNGWTAAHGWEARRSLAAEAVRLAGEADRPVMVIGTAGTPDTDLLDRGAASRAVENMKPQPWRAARGESLAALAKLKPLGAEVLWLSDGIEDGHALETLKALKRLGRVRLFRDRADESALGIVSVANTVSGLEAQIRRADRQDRREGRIAALGRNGETLSSARYVFKDGETETRARLDLPLEMRNKTVRLAVEGEKSAGAAYLFDRGVPRRAVGIVAAEKDDTLLSARYYLTRALSPYADLTAGSIEAELARKPAVLILADIGRIAGTDHDALRHFVENGGLLIRFAGERMTAGSDDLVPVRLRSGGRSFGGALSWAAPQTLAPFPTTSPFSGLVIPPDVTVSKQILAEPSIALSRMSWARLKDGTPMVTAARRGRGWIVLFHVTAGPDWSNLSLSGLYVDMLRRLLPLAAGTDPRDLSADAMLAPVSTLDGFGRLRRAGAELAPIKAAKLADVEPSRLHPPGLYGAGEAMRALNTMRPDESLTPLAIDAPTETYAAQAARDLAPPLFAVAALLLFADLMLSLYVRGYLPDWRRLKRAILPLICLAALFAPDARADDGFAMKAALDTRLAFVVTGDVETDAMSRAGLIGLGRALRTRTAYEPQDPMAVDLEHDPLNFFPLIYWPMTPGQKTLSPQALHKLSEYMRLGGTLLIDTRDATLGASRGPDAPGQRALRRLIGALDLPPLEPVPHDHVLTRAFYLLQDFPGRWAGDTLWVAKGAGGDGVSPIIIGDADWAAAWAVDERGRPLTDPSPGGESQREMALRFGINAVMYALTGNYKTDQIHVPSILKRLGE